MVTGVPTGPEVGFRLVMLGGGFVTVKVTPLLGPPLTVTTMLPVVAPVGTGATIIVGLQLEGVDAEPLKVTVLVHCVFPKFVPVIKTEVPTGPDGGVMFVMLGVGRTVKATPLLAIPPTVATTLPVVDPAGTGTAILVALQLLGVATIPLNVSVLVP